MHHDLISDELGLCWKHVQEQRTRRKETRKIHPDGKNSPLRDDGSALTNLMSSSTTSSSSSYNDSRKRLTYREKMLHFTQNYSSSDFSTSAGLGMMLHSAIILKDTEDIFRFFLAPRTSGGVQRTRVVISALTTIRNSKGFLPLQSAVDTRLEEQRVLQLYRACPAAASDTAMEGLIAGLWAIEQINEYTTSLARTLLEDVPKYFIRTLLKRPRAASGSFLHRFVIHPSSQLATLNFLKAIAPQSTRWRDQKGRTPLHAACLSGGAPTIVDGLVRCDRDTAKMTDKFGWPPLFSLVSSLGCHKSKSTSREVTVERYTRGEIEMMLDSLLTAHSPTLLHVANDGSTVLHVMIHYQAPVWLLERTMNEIPGTVGTRDASGRNMLHLVCGGIQPIDIDHILRLHKRAPEEYDTDGRTPLWTLLTNDQCMDMGDRQWRMRTVLSILSACPAATNHTNPLRESQIPLHYVLHSGWIDLARVLVVKNPNRNGGLDCEDVKGRVPLHAMVSRKGNFVEVVDGQSGGSHGSGGSGQSGRVTEDDVKWIVETYPEGPSRRDGKNHVPLHYAQQKRAPEFVKEWLLACHVGDPIDVDCTSKETLRSGIRKLLQSFPERALERDGANQGAAAADDAAGTKAEPSSWGLGREKGNLPLHYALSYDCDPTSVKELLSLNPGTALAKNSHGLPPMHLTATRGGNQHTLAHLMLLHSFSPKAHQVLAFNKTVLHYACEFRQSIEIIKYILSLDQWQTKHRDNLGRAPAHHAYDNNMHAITKLLLSVFADLDDLLLRMSMEILRDALNARGCVFMVDAVGGNILHRLASNPRGTHVLRAISWYQPWLCRQKNNRGQMPIDVANEIGTPAHSLPLEQAVRMRLPPEEGGEFHGNLSPTIKKKRLDDDDPEEIRSGTQTQRLRHSDVFTDSDDEDEDEDEEMNRQQKLSDMNPEEGLRKVLEIFWISYGKQEFGIAGKLAACRVRQELTTYHLICDTLGRIRKALPEFSNVPLLPILIPIRWMGEGYGSTENVAEVRASTMAVLRKAVGYKDLALDNITDFSHFRLYFLCEASFLSLKDEATGLKIPTFDSKNSCCHQGERFQPQGGYHVRMPKLESIVKIRPLIVLSLCLLRCGLFARERHDEFEEMMRVKRKEKEDEREDKEEDENEDEDEEEREDEDEDEDENKKSLSHGWGNSVPSLFAEFPSPLHSDDLAFSYLMDVFGSIYKTDFERMDAFHPKEVKRALVEMEKLLQKYKMNLPKIKKDKLRRLEEKKQNDLLTHCVHRLTGRHVHACEEHRKRDTGGLIPQEMDRKSATNSKSKVSKYLFQKERKKEREKREKREKRKERKEREEREERKEEEVETHVVNIENSEVVLNGGDKETPPGSSKRQDSFVNESIDKLTAGRGNKKCNVQ